MTYREQGGEADVPCSRCGLALAPTAEVLGHRAEVGDDRLAHVVIPRPEAEAIHQGELVVRVAPSPADERDYRAESLSVTVPRLLAHPAGSAP